MSWFSKKKWYVVSWKFENWARSTYTDIVKATCCAQAAYKVAKKRDNTFIVKVEEIEKEWQ